MSLARGRESYVDVAVLEKLHWSSQGDGEHHSAFCFYSQKKNDQTSEQGYRNGKERPEWYSAERVMAKDRQPASECKSSWYIDAQKTGGFCWRLREWQSRMDLCTRSSSEKQSSPVEKFL